LFTNITTLKGYFSISIPAKLWFRQIARFFGGNMLRKFHTARHLLSLGLILALSAAAFADTLRLKNGSIIKGRIVSFSGGKFTVAVGEGSRSRQMSFDASEVESIQFDAPSARPDSVTSSERTAETPVRKDPEFIETSSPPKSVPRVITTDTTAKPESKTVPVKSTATLPPVKTTSSSSAKPVEVSIKVFADNTSNGWTNSGWVVKKGQKIRIIGDGTVSLGKGRSTGPSGSYDLADETKLLKSVPTGALIAVIGDDNNEFIYVGAERTFIASRDGSLFLGLNEGNLDDNSGTFDVRIEIDPA
jgi:PA-IL-like protein